MIRYIFAILFLIISSKLNAEEVRLYELKVKLKPKVVREKVFWQNKEKINWFEEIKYWNFERNEKLPSFLKDKLPLIKNTQLIPIPEVDSLKIVSSGPFVLSRELDIELEEYPLFNLDVEMENAELFIYLGIDYNMDGLIDDYLSLDTPGEFNLLDLAKERCEKAEAEYKDEIKLKNIILFLPPCKEELRENILFILRGISFYNEESLILDKTKRFPYPLRSRENKLNFLEEIKKINPSLLKIDDLILKLNDFELPEKFEDLERTVLVKRIELTKGKHRYEKIENPTFDIEWAIFEPVAVSQKQETKSEPTITFKKINPTKYLVKVEGAKQPFWLVFSESFHKQWKLYKIKNQKSNIKYQKYFEEIVADYPKLKVKEAKHLMKFTPEDIRFLWEKPLDAEHQLVNGYANGWYIKPKELGLGENFVLVVYFWPQSLFYLGLFISGTTFLFCIIYLVYSSIKKHN